MPMTAFEPIRPQGKERGKMTVSASGHAWGDEVFWRLSAPAIPLPSSYFGADA